MVITPISAADSSFLAPGSPGEDSTDISSKGCGSNFAHSRAAIERKQKKKKGEKNKATDGFDNPRILGVLPDILMMRPIKTRHVRVEAQKR